ncbi:flavoprotein [Micromonospora fluostatini]|uniref:flavoprotein n=1 Tax=Micromonospora sp. JCM 30529 TaxID=3421643 RepID=UPI003D179D6B
MTSHANPVLLLVVTAAPPAAQIGQLVAKLLDDHWDVTVVATPTALSWIDPDALAHQTGHPVRSQARQPGEPKSLPRADAIAVVPATFNTINKWSSGINDTLALGILNEALAEPVPIVAAPYAKAALSSHPAFPRNLQTLQNAGVDLIPNEAIRPATPDDPFHWDIVIDRLRQCRPTA